MTSFESTSTVLSNLTMADLKTLQSDAIQLLQDLIRIESLSKEEHETADRIQRFLKNCGIRTQRMENNVYCYNKHFDASKPTVLLNSHHDTVKPNPGYTRDPFSPDIEDGKLYGLGSNDAGGCLVSLMAAFRYFNDREDLAYNVCFAGTSEEEISGPNGLELLYPDLENIEFAIVGEPTLMDIAVAEKGLMVIDCTAMGVSGHAAREEGDNALYKALDDINWVRNYQFEKVSEHLGAMKMSATIIKAGYQHNVVPERCEFVLDVRVTDQYTNEEVFEIIEMNLQSEITPRSVRLRPSFIEMEHPLVKAALKQGAKPYGSPTTSDQALVPVPSAKMGPGDSARSHSADEFVWVHEIEEGVEKYIKILEDTIVQK